MQPRLRLYHKRNPTSEPPRSYSRHEDTHASPRGRGISCKTTSWTGSGQEKTGKSASDQHRRGSTDLQTPSPQAITDSSNNRGSYAQESMRTANAISRTRREILPRCHDGSRKRSNTSNESGSLGGVFSGSQHAANGSHSVLYRLSDRSNTIGAPSPPANPDQHQIRTSRQHWLPSTDVTTANGTTTNTTTTNNNRTPHGDERWPVKVTIHSIDYSSMTLSGTMEAFNVPDKSSPTQESSITTFLEGEIIDFNTYTLETKSFKADARIDGTYWRKLEPFKRLTDDEIVRNLVSRRWLTEVLSRNWILMRWKGMLHPQYSTSRRVVFLSLYVVCFVCPGLL